MPIQPYSDDAAGALSLLITFMMWQEKFAGQDGKRLGKGTLASEWKINRQNLGKFLQRTLNRQTDEKLYNSVVEKTYEKLTKNKIPVSGYMRSVAETIYSKDMVGTLMKPQKATAPKSRNHVPIISDLAVLERNSGYPEKDSSKQSRTETYPMVSGLSLLVRPSNETVRENGKPQDGISVSLVNIVPEFVETGLYHPVFKIKQMGAKKANVNIEGIVLTQSSRFILSGRDTEEKRSAMLSVFYNAEQAKNYREQPANGNRPHLSGVMLGLSNSVNHFGSLFSLYAVPGGNLTQEKFDNKEARKAFDDVYERAQKTAGVYTEAGLEEVLNKLGITNCMDDIREMLARSDQERVFSLT